MQAKPFLRILFPLVGGIILGRDLPHNAWCDWTLPGIPAVLFILSLFKHRGTALMQWANVMILLFFFFIGLYLGRPVLVPDMPGGIIYGRVCGEVQRENKSLRCLIDRISYFDGKKWNDVKGMASVYLEAADPSGEGRLSSDERVLVAGDCLMGRGKLRGHQEPVNPGQFDYGAFQRGRGIFYRIYLDASSWNRADESYGIKLKIRAISFRRELIQMLESGVGGDIQILNSLMLGYRGELDTEVRQNFVRSGTMHILAVSGLHVGILYLLPSLLLRRLKPFPAAWIIGHILVFSGLWMYAFITGLSSSVVRAVIMCCVHGIAGMSKRKVNSLHVVSLAAFFMILARPAIVFEAGFQLSFAALAGIISCYSLLLNRLLAFFPSAGWLGNMVARMVSVSVSAQLGTIPLSIFYFQQFSPVSVLANLVVIPLATGIIYTGLGFFVFGKLQLIATIMAALLRWMSSLLEWFTRSLASLSWSSIDGLSLTPFQVFLLFLVGLMGMVHFHRRTGRSLIMFLSGIILCLSVSCFRELLILSSADFYVFSVSGKTAIGFIQGKQAVLFRGPDVSQPDSIPWELESFFQRQRLKPLALTPGVAATPGGSDDPMASYPWLRCIHSPGMDAVYAVFADKKILILSGLDKEASLGLPPLRADILVLCNNPRINISHIVKHLNVSMVVADGSNYPFYLDRVRDECSQLGVPFHSTLSKGYFSF